MTPEQIMKHIGELINPCHKGLTDTVIALHEAGYHHYADIVRVIASSLDAAHHEAISELTK